MNVAGGSARREYERRRAREVAHQQANKRRWVWFTIATPFVVYAAVRLGLPWLVNSAWRSIVESSKVETTTPDPMNAQTANLVALLAALGATMNVIKGFWGRRQSTEAWAKGADGEVRTARCLDGLPESFVVRHDLAMPGSRANIDHVVVGPTGVFTVETKSYRDGVHINRGRVTVGGRRQDGIADQANWQATAISARVDARAQPIVVVHGGVTLAFLSSPIVDGVRFCSPGRLAKVLKSGAARLTPDQVAQVVARLDGSPRSDAAATAPVADACACGGEWVERARQSDGGKFLGCSRFPACRSTRSLV